ncbi:MAG: tetratricopeptide repeat protein [Candidatus Andersenbacteria bacterium]|nr:tetratricopeptide repeat protein [Candidatus Andersenbacteria bacterium]
MDTIADKSWRVNLIAAAVIAAVGFIAYSNSWQVPFVYDDLGNIVHNEALQTFDFTSWQSYRGMRALPHFTLVVNWRLGGLNVIGYHIVNLVIHIINGLLVYWLCLALGRRSYAQSSVVRWRHFSLSSRHLFAGMAALLFVSHPVATEAVTYVVQRTVSLTALFYLLSLAAYMQWRTATPSPRHAPGHSPFVGGRMIWWPALSWLAALAAMHSKQTAVTLPVAVALLEVFFFAQRYRWRRSLVYLMPWLLLLAYLPWRMYGAAWLFTDAPAAAPALDATGNVEASEALAAAHTPLSRSVYFLTQFGVVLKYLRLIIWPVGQSIDHDFTVYQSFFAWPVLLGAGLTIILLTLAWWLRLRRPVAAFGMVFFFLALAPESSLVPLLEVVAEYRLYLPLAGAAIVTADVVAYLYTNVVRSGWIMWSMAVVIVALTVGTSVRNITWRDPVVLWSDAIRKAPAKARPHNNLGAVLLDRGEYAAARDHLETAVESSPGFAAAHHNLGTALAMLGDLNAAARHYEEARALGTTITATRVNLATVYLKLGKLSEAEALLNDTLARDNRSPAAHNLLGAVRLKQGQREAAREQFEAALKIDPAYASARRNLELTYE